MSDRIEEYHEYQKRVKACHLCDPDVDHSRNSKSVPMYVNPDLCEALVVVMQPEEVDHSRQQVTLLTGEKGKALSESMSKAGLEGTHRVGVTSVIKCKLAVGNAKVRCAKQCAAEHLQWELDFLQPKVIVLLGREPVKFILPDLLKLRNMIGLSGSSMCLIDQWYVFGPDLKDLLSSAGVNGTFKTDSKMGERAVLLSTLEELKELL